MEPPGRARPSRPQLVRDGAQALLAGSRRADELWRSPRPHALRRSLWRSRVRHYDRPEAARADLCRSDPLCRARRDPERHRQFQGGVAGRRRRRRLYDRSRPGQRRADRQFILQDGGGTPLRLRRCDARGVQGDPRRRPHPPARRSGDRGELGHDQSRADGRGVQEVLDGPGRGAQPRDPRPACRTASASICAGAAGTDRT